VTRGSSQFLVHSSQYRWFKGSVGGLRTIAEMAADMVTKHAKGLNLWLRLVETRTVGAVRATFFGGREFN
jgi:hypothetical protein